MKLTQAIVSVGKHGSDIEGFTNSHLQSAVERVASLGGGAVEVSAGIFMMDDALHLASNVTVRGQGAATVFRKTPMRKAAITTILGYGHTDIITDNPDIFKVGDGVVISSAQSHGFLDTTGTLLRREGDIWFNSRTFNNDYNSAHNATLRTLHPLVDAVGATNASLEEVTLDGNAAFNEQINGCRGAAFYALNSQQITAHKVAAHDFNGDGFSFQTCDNLTLDTCFAEKCHGNGFHPGSGSNRFHIKNCTARACHGCGLFYCLRVRNSILETSLFEDNHSHGIYIWARDNNHINRHLTIRRNGGCGICYMNIPPSHSSNNHTFSECTLTENCTRDGQAEILLQGSPRNTTISGLNITRHPGKPAIMVTPNTPPFTLTDTTITPPGPDAITYL
ncbi:MAG: hypothetical protein GX230_02360 [Lentisphaerae bacterium]|nr:hypothetical protein [Lentisphaerota bacterium]